MLDAAELKALTQQDLAMLGYGEVAYIRSVDVQGEKVFAIMGADGRQIGLAGDRASATMAASDEDLTIVAVN
jgi:hypothetical protein